jgi:hypothetical protein
MLVEYPTQTNQAWGCTDPGTIQPSPDVIRNFDQSYLASLGDAGGSIQPPVVCIYQQLIKGTNYSGSTCAGTSGSGWCYVTNTESCAQAIQFGGSGPPAGTILDMECNGP